MRQIHYITCLIVAIAASALSAMAELTASGTGFIISNNGLIATSYSLIKGQQMIVVYGLDPNFTSAYQASVARVDEAQDLAILSVEKSYEQPLPYVIAAAESADTVSITTYPAITTLRTKPTVVSAVLVHRDSMVYLSTAMEHNALGAAVQNAAGEVIGFVAADSAGNATRVSLLGGLREFVRADSISDATHDMRAVSCAIAVYDTPIEISRQPQKQVEVRQRDMAAVRAEKIKILKLEMVAVEGGTYMMGCSGQYADCQSAEKPAHEVTVQSFHISKYEVTQAQWMQLMDVNPSPIKGDNMPVYNVSYEDAMEFIRRLNASLGSHFRLPTEAEWEFAAKGGVKSQGYQYAGSDKLDDVAWYRDNSGAKPHDVGTKKPNELGLYDMSGNVSEWCKDDYVSYSAPDYKPYYYSTGTDTFEVYKIDEDAKLKNALTKGRKVMRGSGYFYEKARCNVSYRRACATTDRYTFGFRLVEAIEEKEQ